MTAEFMSSEILSIVVLTYNRPKQLTDCLNSLKAQTLEAFRFEIVVVDDGSDKPTEEAVRSFKSGSIPLSYFRQENSGVATARNTGIDKSKGDLIAFVDDDFILPPNYCKTIVDFFCNHPDAFVIRFSTIPSQKNFISGMAHLPYEQSIQNAKLEIEGSNTSKPVTYPATNHGLDASNGAAFRRTLFERFGMFDAQLKRHEDADFSARLRKNNIDIYYDPWLKIKHQYSERLLDVAKKHFIDGIYQYPYAINQNPGFSLTPFRVLKYLLHTTYYPVRRAWRTNHMLRFVVCLPFLYVLHILFLTGFFVGWLQFRGKRNPETQTC